MTTVSVPYGFHVDAQTLAVYIKNPLEAKSLGHMSSFFTEVDPEDQMAFAAHFKISESDLIAAAKEFAELSGMQIPLAA